MSSPEAELRRQVADGLQALNEHNGGRSLSAIGRTIGVDRTTITRWARGLTSASVDHCRALAAHYPDHFDEHTLVELHARAAIGAVQNDVATVGVSVTDNGAELHRLITASIRADPGPRQNHVLKMGSLTLDRRGTDSAVADPLMSEENSREILEFRRAMVERAAEGWRMRFVMVARNPVRLEMFRNVVDQVDGPDVEIRAYAASVPMSLSPLIVANRDVVLAYDHRRFERPDAGIILRSRPIVEWADHYFDQLYMDAPYVLRDLHGPSKSGFDDLRRAMGTGA